MNIQHLRYFVAVAEAGSITSAAEELRMSQPSLSRQIKAFEDALDCQLLERGARSIRLTTRGEAVRDEGVRMLRSIDMGILRIREIVDDEVIRIGYAPSLGGEILQSAVASFSQCHPKVKLDLKDCSNKEMKAGLLSGALDLCIDVADKSPEIEWVKLLEKPLVLAVPNSHRLLREKPNRRVVKVEELESASFLLFSRYDYPTAWQEMVGYFKGTGVNVKIAGEFDGIVSLSLALEAGLGIALVISNTTFSNRVKKIQLKPQPDPVCVSVGWSNHKALDVVKESFVAELKRAAG
jgi:DNA-binding transcriptional LysR family regulator